MTWPTPSSPASGPATSVEALVAKAREISEVRRIVAHTPLERPASGRALEKAGFAMVREMDDADDEGNVARVKLRLTHRRPDAPHE